jgi:hypothetical protein
MTEPHHVDWTQINWEDLYPRLLLVASKLRRLTWRGKHWGPIPGTPTEQDFVQEAILKTMDGTRTWSREISLFQHLAGVILSDINHLATSEENKTTALADDTVVQIQDYRSSPETMVLRKRQEEQFLNYLEGKKPKLRQLAHLILYERVRTSAHFMVKLNLSFQEVESLKKALRRATEEYPKTQEGDPASSVDDLKSIANDN